MDPVLALEYVNARKTLLLEAMRSLVGDLPYLVDVPSDSSENNEIRLLLAARDMVRAVNHLGPAHFPEGWLS